MNTLQFILNKYNLENTDYIEIPNAGRDDLAALFCELDFKKGVEIGVEKGIYSEVLCKANPQMEIYGVDSWMFGRPYEENIAKRRTQNSFSQERCDRIYEEAKKRLSPYSNYKIIRGYSIDAVEQFEDESLDFVYIDANHEYSFVMDDIIEWSKKVKRGGIIAGHDYYMLRSKVSSANVKTAVNDYVKENNVKPLIIWGERVGVPGEVRDKYRSWSWIK